MFNTIIKNKKILIIAIAAVILIIIFGGGRSAENAAKDYVEAMLDGNAKKAVSLMSDITIEKSNYATKKLLIHAMEEKLEAAREGYKDKYGDRWKYKVKVIDSYDADLSDIEDYIENIELGDSVSGKMKDVAITVTHKGSGWFNDKEGSEEMVIRCIKQGRKWYVLWGE